jgi:hypothetical protein
MTWIVNYGSDIAVLSMKAESCKAAAIKACHLIGEKKKNVSITSPAGEKITSEAKLRDLAEKE